MRKDCIAITKFFYWLENILKNQIITEYDAEIKLENFRKEMDKYIAPSFRSISAYGVNAAMMHYSADPKNSTQLESKGMYLIDSGGHYLDGTTDITRTIALGNVTNEEKKAFTLTLKGIIQLSEISFLKGSTGANLDILCRQFLWNEYIDYKCSTGHGVGFYLNIHEGPQNFSQHNTTQPMELGMITTIEPGVYIKGKYGLRIENMLLTAFDKKNEWGEFYKFETLTFLYIDKNLIDKKLLSESEINWINTYHSKTYKLLSPNLTNAEKKWLKKKTEKL